METVLLTTFEKEDDFVKRAGDSCTQIALKFDEFYLAAGSGLADLLSTNNLDLNMTVISQKLSELKFWALIPTSKGLSYDFEFRHIHLADVHVCPVIQRTMTGELNDVSSENSMRRHLAKWNSELFNIFILFR